MTRSSARWRLQSEQIDYFDSEMIDLLTLFSTQASLALENARLYSTERRRTKRGRYGSVKHVYPEDVMAALRTHVTGLVEELLPDARLLYWT